MPKHREKLVLPLIRLGEFRKVFLERAFKLHALGHVADKASRVKELTVLPESARVDQNMLDRSVFASKLRRKVINRLTGFEPPPKLIGLRRIDFELAEATTDVLVCRIAKHPELRGVGPQNGAVGAGLMQPLRRVFQKIRQLLFTELERLLCSRAKLRLG